MKARTLFEFEANFSADWSKFCPWFGFGFNLLTVEKLETFWIDLLPTPDLSKDK